VEATPGVLKTANEIFSNIVIGLQWHCSINAVSSSLKCGQGSLSPCTEVFLALNFTLLLLLQIRTQPYLGKKIDAAAAVAWQQLQLLHPQSSCTCAQTVLPRTHHDST
jgi:hypothetical protein